VKSARERPGCTPSAKIGVPAKNRGRDGPYFLKRGHHRRESKIRRLLLNGYIKAWNRRERLRVLGRDADHFQNNGPIGLKHLRLFSEEPPSRPFLQEEVILRSPDGTFTKNDQNNFKFYFNVTALHKRRMGIPPLPWLMFLENVPVTLGIVPNSGNTAFLFPLSRYPSKRTGQGIVNRKPPD